MKNKKNFINERLNNTYTIISYILYYIYENKLKFRKSEIL